MAGRVSRFLLGARNPETGRREGGLAGAFRDADGDFTTPQQALISNIGRRIERASINRNIVRDNRGVDARRQEMIAAERPQRAPPILGVPESLRQPDPVMGPPSSMAQPWQRTNYSVESRNGPTVNGRQMTQAEYDRYRNDSRSILNERAGRDNPMDAVDRGPLTSYVDRSAATRSGTGTSSAYARAVQAINARGIGENMIK